MDYYSCDYFSNFIFSNLLSNSLTSSSEEEQKALEGFEIIEWEIEEPIENIYE